MSAPHRRCAVQKRHWNDEGPARSALRRIQANPGAGTLYVPTGVIECGCGGFVLTGSPARKPGCRTSKRGHRGRGRR